MKQIVVAVLIASLGACATSSPDVVQRYEAQRLSQVQDGTILSVRPVVVDGSQSGLGAAAGGVIGGVAGSSVGGSRESVVVGVLGAVLGGVLGNAAERTGTRENALEIVVQLRNGDGQLATRYVDFIYQPVRSAEGAVTGILVVGSGGAAGSTLLGAVGGVMLFVWLVGVGIGLLRLRSETETSAITVSRHISPSAPTTAERVG